MCKKSSVGRNPTEDFYFTEQFQIPVHRRHPGQSHKDVYKRQHYFQGKSDYLRAIRAAVSLPILRKDFIIDPYQIYEARAMGADAILLIAALLDTKTLRAFAEIAHGLGLACLTEVHNEEELASALALSLIHI